MRILFIILEGKGGVGKSTSSALAIHALQDDGKRSVAIVDADTTNSTMFSMFPDCVLVDPLQAEAAGIFASMLRQSEDALVVDTGARAEAAFIAILERILPRAKEEKVAVVCLRPLTLSSFAQNNAVAFVERMAPKGVRVILARILAQGRSSEHFADWHKSKARAAALKLGAVEMDISDVGVRWGDEIPSFGLSFYEVAMGNFSRVDPELQDLANRVFSPGIQARVGKWVEENSKRLLEALRTVGIRL